MTYQNTRNSNADRNYLRSVISKHPRGVAVMQRHGLSNTGQIASKRQSMELCSELMIDVSMALMAMDNGQSAEVFARHNGWADAVEAAFDQVKSEVKQSEVKTMQSKTASNPLEQAILDLVGDAVNADAVNQLIDEKLAEFKPETGGVTKRIIVEQNAQEYSKDGLFHCQFDTLLRAVNARAANGRRVNVMLHGGAGGGKTTACLQVAEVLDLDFESVGYSEFKADIVGSKNVVTGEYVVENVGFARIYRDGGVFLFDDMDRSSPEAQMVVMQALANGFITLPDGQVVRRHEDCIIVCGTNTLGRGNDDKYVTAEAIDAALLDRFSVKIEWTYDRELMVAMSGNEAWARRVISAMDKAETYGVDCVITPRAVEAGAALIAAGFDADEAADMTYLVGLTSEQRDLIED